MKKGWFGMLVQFLRFGLNYRRCSQVLRKLPQPRVVIFGGMRADRDAVYVEQASHLASKLVRAGASVITGGGPGVMVAANCGAYAVKKDKVTVGVGVSGIDEDFENPCAPVLKADRFFIRKLLFANHSDGIVIFPGGIGTLDEFFEILNLRKHSMVNNIPIILVGRQFWEPLYRWFIDSALKEGLIKQDFLEFFTITDDIDHVLRHILKPGKEV